MTPQVGSACPKCWTPLFYEKEGKQYRAYEIAHIYPLNPTEVEANVLANEPRLSEDVNHPDNLVPLCERCHGIFDKPRTASEYRELYELKQKLIRAAAQIEIRAKYPLEEAIGKVVVALHGYDAHLTHPTNLSYSPISVDRKLGDSIPPIVRRKIKLNVSDYFQFIKQKFLELEEDDPNCSDLICSQVKSYYLQQKTLNIPKQEIYSNIVDWFHKKAGSETIEAAEIVASFFVQNCEVFE
ncbi:ABC-three component system protein [Xanthomonas translucens]|uniref:ABC-three component system protein n=1 Tax=Xanthomonas campestris pv. translucens TaxID=343 RepID=UPI0018C722DE|nr:ABC-three component system protein [Xanthomonas translucens]MCT8282445.1 HNH endonuclease [Xanthomonas translucens pv. undulosa]MCT8317133.1 HNH endonuclease [Xanthomonas translucens pv. undulosa]UKE43536.1 HNH endonuclease [Xanthomonas translucens pv. secalis]WLA16068.1 HNH endonuclease [Xanthomonas translucens]